MLRMRGDRLYSRKIMAFILSHAAQFAHVSLHDIDEHLDDIYNPRHRFGSHALTGRHNNWYLGIEDYRHCIHDHFVLAYWSGHGKQLFCPIGTSGILVAKHGVLCPVCLCSSKVNGGVGSDLGLEKWFCPSLLTFSGRTEADWNLNFNGSCVCGICYKEFVKFFSNNKKRRAWMPMDVIRHLRPAERDAAFIAVAVAQLKNEKFRKRLVTKGEKKLRFDPRKTRSTVSLHTGEGNSPGLGANEGIIVSEAA